MPGLPIQRKRDRDQEEEANALAYGKIYDSLPEIVDAMIGLAVGVKVRDPVAGDVYVEAPNFKAGAYLIDRVMGRTVAQTKDLTKERAVDSLETFVKEMQQRRLEAGEGYVNPPLPPAAVEASEVRELKDDGLVVAAPEDLDREKAREALWGQ